MKVTEREAGAHNCPSVWQRILRIHSIHRLCSCVRVRGTILGRGRKEDKGLSDTKYDTRELELNNDGLDDNEQDESAHSQQLQSFLQKAPDIESLKPRLALKSSIDELLSVIKGSNRRHFLIGDAREMMREFVANALAKCHEQNTGRKRSGIVSYNQEREPKKCRHLDANQGIR